MPVYLLRPQQSPDSGHYRSGGGRMQGAEGGADGMALHVHLELEQAADGDLLAGGGGRARAQRGGSVYHILRLANYTCYRAEVQCLSFKRVYRYKIYLTCIITIIICTYNNLHTCISI